MRSKILVDLYGGEQNFAIIHLPTRSTPGAVFQLDSLARIAGDLKDALHLLRSGNASEAISELEAICSEFDEILAKTAEASGMP